MLIYQTSLMLKSRPRCSALMIKAWPRCPAPNCVIAIYVKNCYCWLWLCATWIVRVKGNVLAQNRRNSLPCTVKTFRQMSCNQMVGCLLCNMIYDLKNGSLDKHKVVWSLVVVRIAFDLKYRNTKACNKH